MDLPELLRAQAGKYRCPDCTKSMADCGIEILVQQGNHALVRVTCSGCRDENLLKIVLAVDPARASGRRRAASRAAPLFDEAHPSDANPIAADEVIDLHSTLRDWTGDLRSLVVIEG